MTPPAKFVHDEDGRRGAAISSLVSGGCIISGATLRRTLLFTGVWVHSYSEVTNAVVLPYVEIGASARLFSWLREQREERRAYAKGEHKPVYERGKPEG